MDPDSGVLTVAGNVDREAFSRYVVIVTVSVHQTNNDRIAGVSFQHTHVHVMLLVLQELRLLSNQEMRHFDFVEPKA